MTKTKWGRPSGLPEVQRDDRQECLPHETAHEKRGMIATLANPAKPGLRRCNNRLATALNPL
jgi:hypothetical protein